jgi:hypothetical protein
LPLSAKLQEEGELFDHDFDLAGIRNNVASNKDGITLHRRRSVILTNKALIQREITKEALAAEKREERAAKKARKAQDSTDKAAAGAAGTTAAFDDIASAAAMEEDETLASPVV